MKMYTSGFTEEQRNTIREDLTRFTQERASLLGFPPEAAVQEIRYWQQSYPNWSTNPNQTAKRSSFEHHPARQWPKFLSPAVRCIPRVDADPRAWACFQYRDEPGWFGDPVRR